MFSLLANKYSHEVHIVKSLCGLVVKRIKFQHIKHLKSKLKTRNRLIQCSVTDPNTSIEPTKSYLMVGRKLSMWAEARG